MGPSLVLNAAIVRGLNSVDTGATMELPIICTLTEEQLRERRQTFLDSLREASCDITPIPDGFSYAFKASPEVVAQLGRLVELERQCCRFLTFRIVEESGEHTVRLEITGAPEAKPVIADLFGGTL